MKLFNLMLNSSGIKQGVYRDTGDFMGIPEGCVADLGRCKSGAKHFTPVDNFLKMLTSQEKNRFYIQRTFALGDTLMAVPVIRWMEKQGWEVFLRCNGKFSSLMSKLKVRNTNTVNPTDGEMGLMMDWILEADHGNSPLSKYHRIEIYFRALGADVPRADELDWSWDPDTFPHNPVTDDGPYVVFVGWGANNRKQLPVPAIEAILKSLNAEGIKVYYSGNPPFSWDLPLTVPTSFAWTTAELFPAIARARAIITMDTGPLWVAHFTKTPTVNILGPTGSEVHRLSFHPLYPEGAVPIKMNEWVNCPTCFENAAACNFKMKCLNSNTERLVSEVKENVMRFWSNSDGC